MLSPVIELGDFGEVQIKEPGEYTIYSEQFNPKAKVIVQ
jgi:hypothetical protein